jgi:MFS family permease
VPVDGSYLADVLPVMIPIGLGAGLFFPSLTTLAVSGVSPSESGLASGLLNTTLQVGGAIGLAVLATLAATRTDDLVAGGESNASALTGGYHLAFLIGAGLVAVAMVVALTVLGRGRARGAEQEEEARPTELNTGDPAYSEAA